MRNLFWLLVGVALTVFVVLKGKELYRKLTPAGVAEQVEQQGKKAAANLGDFVGTFRAAVAEREAELRAELNIPATND